jgi:hypothetical protein
MYILNTALYSFGSIEDASGQKIDDRKKLRIETRNLHKWTQENTKPFKILVAHHPADWLVDWAKAELHAVASRSFDLLLQGHEHTADAVAYSRREDQLILSSAPALYTAKREQCMGYSIIVLDPEARSVRIRYRQWVPKDRKFVAGSQYSATDDGVLTFPLSRNSKLAALGSVTDHLRVELEKSMSAYNSLSHGWVAT